MNRWYLRYGIPAALLALLIWRTELWRADEVLSNLRWWPVVVALLLNLPQLLPLTLRIHVIFRRFRYRASLGALLPLAVFGNMASALTPAASGEAFRPVLYRDRFGMPLHEGWAAVFYERAYSFYLMALTSLAAVVMVFLPWPFLAPAVAILVLALFPAPAWLYPAGVEVIRFIGRLPLLKPLTARKGVQSAIEPLTKVDELVAELFRDFRLSVEVTVLSYCVFFFMGLQFWFVIRAFGESLALHEAWATLSVSYFAGTASAIPLGLGTTDGTLVFFLTRFHVRGATSTAITLLVRLTATLPYGLMGLLGYAAAARDTAGVATEALVERPEKEPVMKERRLPAAEADAFTGSGHD